MQARVGAHDRLPSSARPTGRALDPQAQRPHVGPYGADVGQALGPGALGAFHAPAEWDGSVGRPARVLCLVIDNREVDRLIGVLLGHDGRLLAMSQARNPGLLAGFPRCREICATTGWSTGIRTRPVAGLAATLGWLGGGRGRR